MFSKEGNIMSWLHLMIFIPFLFAIFVPYLYKHFVHKIHTGWFVLIVPAFIFIYLLTYISEIAHGNTIISTLSWIPSYQINFTTYIDGLSLIFGLLITGIGA